MPLSTFHSTLLGFSFFSLNVTALPRQRCMWPKNYTGVYCILYSNWRKVMDFLARSTRKTWHKIAPHQSKNCASNSSFDNDNFIKIQRQNHLQWRKRCAATLQGMEMWRSGAGQGKKCGELVLARSQECGTWPSN